MKITKLEIRDKKNKEKYNQEKIWNEIAEKWSEFRNRTVQEVIEFLKDKKGKVLDLGCGSGRNFLSHEFNEKLKFYGVDFSEEMLKFAEEKIKNTKVKAALFKSQVYDLPFEDNFFDSCIFISALHCIEYEENRKKTLLEIFRVLKKGKQAMISVWNKNANPNIKTNDIKEGYVNWREYKRYYYFYEQKELETLLKDCGFKVLKSSNYTEDKHTRKNIVIYVEK